MDEVEETVPEKPHRSADEEHEILHVNTLDESVEINNVRLFAFEEVDLTKLVNCTSLSMRKNLIHNLDPFPKDLCQRLIELDLFDNKVKLIGSFFTNFSALRKLDLSYNQIKEIEGLSGLPTLEELYLVENRIKDVKGLECLRNLRLLELGGNRIREVGDGLSELINLEELWLGKNKIVTLGSSFNKLTKLRRLSLQANRITKIEAINFPAGANEALSELYLSENGIQEITNLDHLPNLRLLDFSFNPIEIVNSSVVNVENMPILEEFWLTDGKISDWAEVEKLKQFSSSLNTVYLERNPIEHDKRYRDKVYLALPFLSQIDSWPVANKGNLEADRAIHRR